MESNFPKGDGTTNNSKGFSDSHAYETPTPGKTSKIIGVVFGEAFCNSAARSAPPQPGMSLATKAKSGWSAAARRIAPSGVDSTTPSQPKSFKLVIRNFAIVRSESAIRTLGLLMSQLYPQPAFEIVNWPKYWEHGYRFRKSGTCTNIRALVGSAPMSAKAISCCLLLCFLLTFFIVRVVKRPRVVNAAEEQALIITFPLQSGKTGNAEERNKRLYALEDQLIVAIKESGAGEYDGNETGDGVFTIYIYGPSAERLFSVVRPILKKFRPPAGSYLIKRYGKPGSKQDRVALDGDDAPPAQTAMTKFSELSHEDRKRRDQQRAVHTIDMQAAGIVTLERGGHFSQGHSRQYSAAEQSLFPSKQVFGCGIERACRKAEPCIWTIPILNAIAAGPIT
jgi:hypothetical protein